MERVEILLIGTFHLARPNRDLHGPDFDDMLGSRRQTEITAVADRLGSFNPTAIAVEWPHDNQDGLDSRYRQYTSGAVELRVSEPEQLGFRVASAAGLDRLLAIDVEGQWYDPAIEDLIARDPELADRWQAMFEKGEQSTRALSEQLKRSTLGEVLQWLNAPDNRRADLAAYLEYNLWINEPGNWVGADMVANWFQRNIRIATTLDCLVEPGDRAIVIYGAGHAPLLEFFWSWNPRMRLVDPVDYLA